MCVGQMGNFNCKIISYNVRGLRDNIKSRQTFRIFKDKTADIILLQETHITQEIVNVWQNE